MGLPLRGQGRCACGAPGGARYACLLEAGICRRQGPAREHGRLGRARVDPRWMTALRSFGLVAAALLVLAGAAQAEPRVALVIGNSSYGGELAQLPNPANDARLMAKTLKGLGFTVIESEDSDQAQMKRVIQAF